MAVGRRARLCVLGLWMMAVAGLRAEDRGAQAALAGALRGTQASSVVLEWRTGAVLAARFLRESSR